MAKNNIFQQLAQGFRQGLSAGRSGIGKAFTLAGKLLQKVADRMSDDTDEEEEEEENVKWFYGIEPGKVTEPVETGFLETESPIEEAIRSLEEEGYSTYNPNAVYETGEEAFKQTLSNAYDTFGSEIFNQLYHTDMENFNFDNKIIDQAIVQVYEKYQDNDLPQYADILDEIENLIFDMSREKLGR